MVMKENTFTRIYDLTRRIPAGKVSTYGRLAALAGLPRGARIVGYAMASCRDESVPCHRVVDRLGRTKAAFDRFAPNSQRIMLEGEGVTFLPDGRVDLKRHLWRSETDLFPD